MEARIVNACAMQLVLNPWQFNVIITTNLFGDIVSDKIAGIVGGLSTAPDANIGEHAAIFEALHGCAPDIAGKGHAKPLALMHAAAMTLDHIGRQDLGNRCRAAIDQMLTVDQVRTKDLDASACIAEFSAARVSRIRNVCAVARSKPVARSSQAPAPASSGCPCGAFLFLSVPRKAGWAYPELGKAPIAD